jgi:hypothetical protein
MDAQFYLDTREPFIGADLGAVTLSTTDLALYAQANFPVLGGQYWARVGKRMKIRLFGKITTGATPGNLTIDVYYGTGAAANGTILASSAALTLVASQTNISFEMEINIRCVSTGNAGSLEVTGHLLVGTAVIAAGMALIPASAAAAVGSLDLTATEIISIQAKRSGSTAETMTVQDMEVIALN